MEGYPPSLHDCQGGARWWWSERREIGSEGDIWLWTDFGWSCFEDKGDKGVERGDEFGVEIGKGFCG